MKTYIFLTGNIQKIGGIECYINAKYAWLKKNGWEVFIFSPPVTNKKCKIKLYNRHLDKRLFPLISDPNDLPISIRMKTLHRMVRKINTKEKNIIIESHNARAAIWGEMIAESLKAKHIIVLLEEILDDNRMLYMKYKDFYKFKYERREVSVNSMFLKLFSAFEMKRRNDSEVFLINESPVSDVVDKRVLNLKKSDVNIAYIGRLDKKYCPVIFSEVALFCKDNLDKSIQFIIVGDIKQYSGSVDSSFIGVDNVTISKMGEMIPIPRQLFSIIDVVIAGSGSARCSAEEGVKTIVADIENGLAVGLLGYETESSIFADPCIDEIPISNKLNDVLIEKKWEGVSNKSYKKPTVEECCQQNLVFISGSSPEKNYYSFAPSKINGTPSFFMKNIGFFLSSYVPKLILLLYSMRTKRIKNHEKEIGRK